MPYLMGLDISTTGAKALIIDEAGKVIAVANTPQPISQPQPLWSEQNPADWWDGICRQHSWGAGGIRSERRGHQRHRLNRSDARSRPAG